MPSISLDCKKPEEQTLPESNVQGVPAVPERELTQTDELNKKLIQSFLTRLNQTEDFNKFTDSTSSHPNEDIIRRETGSASAVKSGTMSDNSNLSIEDAENDLERIIEADNEHEVRPDEGEDDEKNDEEEKKVVKPKRIIQKPRLKFNAETLKGPRGIASLPSHFDRVKFKGRGYEEQDLNVVLKTYEYWCHRLFPKYRFDDCIAQIESLGSKKAVQTHIKRIRMDILPDENEHVRNEEGMELNNETQNDNQPAEARQSSGLTEQQLERIRMNREKAEKLRKERLMQNVNNLPSTLATSQNTNDQMSDFPTNEELEEMNLELNTPSESIAEKHSNSQADEFPTEEEMNEMNTETNENNELDIEEMLEEIQEVNKE